jgi:hypothetical protein
MFEELIGAVNWGLKATKDLGLNVAFVPLEKAAEYTPGKDSVVTGTLNGVHSAAEWATDRAVDGATGLAGYAVPWVVGAAVKGAITSVLPLPDSVTDAASTVINVAFNQTNNDTPA